MRTFFVFSAVLATAFAQCTFPYLEKTVKVSQRPFYYDTTTKQGNNQECDFWDNPGQSGDIAVLIDQTPSLAVYNFDNRASSFCVNGVWIGYVQENFNFFDNAAASAWAWGENYCQDITSSLYNNQLSSTRYAGYADEYRADMINFYYDEGFMGDEGWCTGNNPALNPDNFASSIIINGRSPWTIYEYDDYYTGSGAQCLCLYPSDVDNGYPSFFPYDSDLDGMGGRISSVQKICDSRCPIKRGLSLMDKEGNIQHSGVFQKKN